MTPVALGSDRFEDEGRGRFARDSGAQFASRYSMHALDSSFFVPDDAAGDMPARAVVIIISPGEKGSVAFVLDEEIDVDEGGDAADEQKYFFEKAGAWICDGGFEGSKRIVEICSHSQFYNY